MKKIKLMIMSLAILASVGGAFATRPGGDCRTAQQYYFAGGYSPTGVWGTNYVCDQSTNVCTYIFDGVATFYPCRIGDYHSIMATDTKPKTIIPKK